MSKRDVEPYLFRFKKECLSPSRFTGNTDCQYDPRLQMAVTYENGRKILAIDSKLIKTRSTKKADVEKGEDQKDSHYWR